MNYDEMLERKKNNEEMFKRISHLEEIAYPKQEKIAEEENYKLSLIEEEINKLGKKYWKEYELIENWEEE